MNKAKTVPFKVDICLFKAGFVTSEFSNLFVDFISSSSAFNILSKFFAFPPLFASPL